MNKPLHRSTRRFRLWTLAACLGILAACSSPGYNDNPSQQVSNPRLGCPAATEFFSVNFSIRVQPNAEQADARVTNDLFRPYCHNIPIPGTIFLTVDLVGPELARTPLTLQVTESMTEAGDDAGLGTYAASPIFDMPARRYPKGVIEARFELPKNGDYTIHLSREGALQEGESLAIPLHVGDAAAVGGLARGLLTPLAVTLAVCLSAYLLIRIGRRRELP